jgi:hypothetical protein
MSGLLPTIDEINAAKSFVELRALSQFRSGFGPEPNNRDDRRNVGCLGNTRRKPHRVCIAAFDPVRKPLTPFLNRGTHNSNTL